MNYTVYIFREGELYFTYKRDFIINFSYQTYALTFIDDISNNKFQSIIVYTRDKQREKIIHE